MRRYLGLTLTRWSQACLALAAVLGLALPSAATAAHHKRHHVTCHHKSGHKVCSAPSIRTRHRHGKHLPLAHSGKGGGNPYAGGGCTAWAWANRPDLPGHLGNARYWAGNAARAGFPVDNTPEVGSIAVYQPGSYGAYAPFGHVAVVQKVEGNRIYISEASYPYDTIIYHRWTGISGVQFIHHKGYGAPTPPPTPPPPTPPPGGGGGGGNNPSAPNRQAITSYNRMQPGAPYHGYFTVAWQPFTAQSNTLTAVGVTVGNPTLPAGVGVPYTVTVRLCSAQPGSDGSCPGQLVEVHPQIVNYGNSAADMGDIAVTPGATYWVEYLQPTAANGQSWVTYWWAGGSTIGSSDQMQAVVQGYNR